MTDEGSHCSARADPSDSGTSMLTARRDPADRFKRDVPALGESPASRACRRVRLSSCVRARFAHKCMTPPHPTPPGGVVKCCKSLYAADRQTALAPSFFRVAARGAVAAWRFKSGAAAARPADAHNGTQARCGRTGRSRRTRQWCTRRLTSSFPSCTGRSMPLEGPSARGYAGASRC